MASWKKFIGEKYSKQEEDFIETFDFSGGGAYQIGKNGLYQIVYIYNESKIIIFFANIKLLYIWIKRKLKRG